MLGQLGVALAAIDVRRNVVLRAIRVHHTVADVVGIGAGVVPLVGGEDPIVGARAIAMNQPRLDDLAAYRELLPDARADRKVPVIHVRRIDLAAARNVDPAHFVGAVGPEGELGRILLNVRCGLSIGPVQTRLGQLRGRHVDERQIGIVGTGCHRRGVAFGIDFGFAAGIG